MMTKQTGKYYFDDTAATNAVNWIERFCTHVKGEWMGKPFLLEPWQKDEIIRPLFGWKETATGLRKYRRAFIFIPRKNGKSLLGAALGLRLLSADNEPGAEVYSAASDRDQARIIFEMAKTMVGQSDELRNRLDPFQHSIVYEPRQSFYKVLSRVVASKHGYNAHAVIFDELHTQPNRDLWDVLSTSQGARRQPLMITFTTAGFDKFSFCYQQYNIAKKVKAGIIKDESLLPVIYESDEDDDIFDPKTWRKANPNFKTSVKAEYIRDEAKRAKDEPGYENTFRRLQLNQWTASDTRWIPDEKWMDCAGQPRELQGRICYAGLDLASTRDIAALVLLFPWDDGSFDVLPFFFIPELSARERTKKDGVNYEQWIREGYIIQTPGNVTDYNFIRKKLNELKEIYNIHSIAYDRWNSSQLIINLQEDGFTCTPFGQGYGSMSAPTKELEKLIYDKMIRHAGNPVMRWMCSNVMIQQDAAGNIKIAKDKSTEKVDGMVALVEAVGEYMTFGSPQDSVYETRGIITL